MMLSCRYQSTDDAGLTLGLPVELSVASGLNALAHCADSCGPRGPTRGFFFRGFIAEAHGAQGQGRRRCRSFRRFDTALVMLLIVAWGGDGWL